MTHCWHKTGKNRGVHTEEVACCFCGVRGQTEEIKREVHKQIAHGQAVKHEFATQLPYPEQKCEKRA